MGSVAYFLFYKTMVDAHFIMIFLFVSKMNCFCITIDHNFFLSSPHPFFGWNVSDGLAVAFLHVLLCYNR